MGKKVTYLGLDIGNYDVKTVNTSTPSGFNVFTTKPYGVSEYLLYNGKYYTPSMDRFAYRKDKTKNENAFIMSLFGISKELIVRAQKKYDRELKRAEETSSYLPSVDSIQDEGDGSLWGSVENQNGETRIFDVDTSNHKLTTTYAYIPAGTYKVCLSHCCRHPPLFFRIPSFHPAFWQRN